ncbi:hypothetical protein DH2020_014110 [Rehmannia glutinosa]|uniref:Retrotransposon Copia-like N-terminal domain-containing protein n=1 Tax=Rehmannia glutinosa TaxID=99300 RepID=A0ABR0WW71_REHGL
MIRTYLITVKLNDTNYLVWRQQVFAAARGYGLDGFLIGKHATPPEFITSAAGMKTTNPAYATWMRQDQVLASWLLSSLSENVLISTVGLTSSKEIWECLEIGFASQSRARIMQYRLQLQTLKKGNLSMREYLNKVKVCCDTLAAAEQKVTEEDQVLHILSGLGNDYDSVMVSITSRVEPCSLREVSAILLSFEGRLENAEATQINMDGSSVHVNFAAQTNNTRRGGQHQSYRGRGFMQQTQGNRGGRFPARGGSFRGRGGRTNYKPRCQVCFYTCHTADKCYHRFNANFVPNSNNGQAVFTPTGYTQGPSANVTSIGTIESSNSGLFSEKFSDNIPLFVIL